MSTHTSHEPPLDERALIGDGRTALLIRADATLDWACLPRFDSPSVFGALLDPEGGGALSVRPLSAFTTAQSYVGEGATLGTRLSASGGELEIFDHMHAGCPEALLRALRCVDGEITFEICFDPRPDMGRVIPEIAAEAGRLALNGELALALHHDRPLAWRQRGAAWLAEVTLAAGEALDLTLRWGEGAQRPLTAAERAAITADGPLIALPHLTDAQPWRPHLLRAGQALKQLIHQPTGAMVAAPTTSLPEWIGGVRNWDYRYTWIRDGSLAFSALARLGACAETGAFLDFVQRRFPDAELPLMCTVDGGPVPAEATLDHLAGCHGSAPVRIGNGAKDQVQLDIYGPLIELAYEHQRAGGEISDGLWGFLQRVLERVEALWGDPDHGIWEPRTGKRHNVHSKLMCWLALDRGAHLAERLHRPDLAQRWHAVAGAVHADVCAHGLDPSGAHFVNAYGEAEPDAALLLIPITGFLPPSDPRVVATVEWLQGTLCHGPFIHRYRSRHDDGVGGEEGAFLLCGFWLVEALALMGRADEAQAVFAAHLGCANHVGLMAEEVDPESGAGLGNFPQAFSHLGVINAALALTSSAVPQAACCG